MTAPNTVTAVGYGLEITGVGAAFVPDFRAKDVATLDFSDIRERMGLEVGDPLHGVFDLDRTLRCMGQDVIVEEVRDSVGKQVVNGVLTTATIATNSRHDVSHFGEQLGPDVHVFTRQDMGDRKPSLAFFEHIVDTCGIRDQAIVMVGDMCLRDVWFAYRARQAGMNVVSVLVEPLGCENGGDYLLGRYADNAAIWLGNRALSRARSLTTPLGV